MARLLYFWDRLRTGFWLFPGMMAVAAIVAAIVLPGIDERLGTWIEQVPWLQTTPQAAGQTLSAFGGAIATASGVVFSTTIVILSLTSQQFGSRLLRTFLTDLTTQLTVGAFIGTSLYTLLVLRVIRESANRPFAPDLSVGLAVLLSVLTLVLLIYFIHHVAVSIQAPNVIRAVAADLDTAIDSLFPEVADRGPITTETPQAPPTESDRPSLAVLSAQVGYLQAVEMDTLLKAAARYNVVLELPVRPGDFLSRGTLLALVSPNSTAPEGLPEKLSRCFLIGSRRTPRQDLECSIYELVEVAIRALSPGINDPFTAMSSLDYLGAALARLASRDMPSAYHFDQTGALRIIAEPSTFESAINAAFDQIRQDARYRADVTLRGLETLAFVARYVDRPERKEVLRRQAEMYFDNSSEFPQKKDREDARKRFDAVNSALDGTVEPMPLRAKPNRAVNASAGVGHHRNGTPSQS